MQPKLEYNLYIGKIVKCAQNFHTLNAMDARLFVHRFPAVTIKCECNTLLGAPTMTAAVAAGAVEQMLMHDQKNSRLVLTKEFNKIRLLQIFFINIVSLKIF